MRTVKFRGIDRKTREVVYGDLIQPCREYEFCPTIKAGSCDYHEVDAESIAQLVYIGADGAEYYEGDILKKDGRHWKARLVMNWKEV